MIIDFTKLPRRNKTYAGANGNKIAVVNEALKRIQPRLNLQRINELIDATPFISDLQKVFYKTMIRERKEKILDMPLQKLQKKERKLKQEHNNETR